VTVAGEPDPVTGYVIDLKWLKDAIEREVLSSFDHHHLNLDVAEFAAGKTVPTTENIAIATWRRMEAAVNARNGAKLHRVRVYETPDLFSEYRGTE
jgi:6-pyruvoyltetrahydropterin/6-carboxytetrahydropterin synthase